MVRPIWFPTSLRTLFIYRILKSFFPWTGKSLLIRFSTEVETTNDSYSGWLILDFPGTISQVGLLKGQSFLSFHTMMHYYKSGTLPLPLDLLLLLLWMWTVLLKPGLFPFAELTTKHLEINSPFIQHSFLFNFQSFLKKATYVHSQHDCLFL